MYRKTKQSLAKLTRLALCATLMVTTNGCIKGMVLPVEPTDWQNNIVSVDERERPLRFSASDEGSTQIKQAGRLLNIQTFRLCNVERREIVDRQGTREFKLVNAALPPLILAASLGAVAGSIALGVHGHHVVEAQGERLTNKTPSTIRSDFSRSQALLAWPASRGSASQQPRGIWASQHEPMKERIKRSVSVPARPCEKQGGSNPYKVGLVAKRTLSPRSVTLGRTNRDGKLVVDLSERIPASWLRPGGVVRLTDVHVNGVRAGVIDLGVLSPQIVEGAWKRLSKARSQCKTGRKQWSCRSVERFLRQYPSSPQAKEAEAMLEDFAHRLEEHAWQRANIQALQKGQSQQRLQWAQALPSLLR